MTDCNLFVPNAVKGGTPTSNRPGTVTNPPPPPIASTIPAKTSNVKILIKTNSILFFTINSKKFYL